MIRSNLRTISTVALVALAACEKSDAAIQTISKDAAEMSSSAAAGDARGQSATDARHQEQQALREIAHGRRPALLRMP